MDVPNSFDIDGQVCVLTGGAGVLCSTMAKAVGLNGAKIALLDIDQDGLDEVSEELSELDIEHITVQTSVLDREDLEDAAETVIDEYGSVDILINGAGGNSPDATTDEDTSFFELPDEAMQNVFNLNFTGTVLTSQVFGQYMDEQGDGVILNISSMNAFTPLTKIPAYSGAKAAVSNFTQWLAVDLAHNCSTDIRVNAIAPGFLLTQQNEYLLIDEETGDLTDRGQTIIDHTPQDRFGEPEDLLTTVLWLISPGSEFVTGTVIPIDGGFSAFSGV
ncbi:MAG: SDR family oxidoreductase [Halapricum sp.]